ncbi:hypothetical protein, partial [Limnobacter sp.]
MCNSEKNPCASGACFRRLVGWLEHTFAVLQKNTNFFAKVFDRLKDDVHNLVSLLHDKQHETKQTSGSSRSQVVNEVVRRA